MAFGLLQRNLCTDPRGIFYGWIMLLSAVGLTNGVTLHRVCDPHQYVTQGTTGIINCRIENGFFTVFWYHSEGTAKNNLLLHITNNPQGNTQKEGVGFASGEFDVHQNGSLIINKAKREHEGVFTVVYFLSQQDEATTEYINVTVTGVTLQRVCDPHQYVTQGTTGIINCRIENGFFTVFWYHSEGTAKNNLLLHITNNPQGNAKKEGVGFASGEFDVHQNGSLIINKVKREHEGVFTVVYFLSQQDEATTEYINVTVTVKPLSSFPIIEQCRGYQHCFSERINHSISCYLKNSYPPVLLTWLKRGPDGDENVPSTPSTVGSLIQIINAALDDLDFKKSLLTLFVCKANDPLQMLPHDESSILVQTADVNHALLVPVNKSFELNSRLKLPCGNDNKDYRVWLYANSTENKFHHIIDSVSVDSNFRNSSTKSYTTLRDGHLVISHVYIYHEGFYACLYSSGGTSGSVLYRVTVYDFPQPAYPIVKGCNHPVNCKLKMERKGNVTCELKGILPIVDLKWEAVNDGEDGLISFSNLPKTVLQHRARYDISLTSQYEVTASQPQELRIQCVVVSPITDFVNMSSTVIVHIQTGSNKSAASTFSKKLLVVIIIVVVVTVLAIICIGMVVKHCKKRRWRRSDKGISYVSGRLKYELPGRMVAAENGDFEAQGRDATVSQSEILRMFKNELRNKYINFYKAVQPMPFFEKKMFSVEKVFVENGISILQWRNGNESWRKLERYGDIFNKDGQSKRFVLEGDPGYGKSTLALQMVHDWCKEIPPMKDFDLLIFLQLRQLDERETIYQSVKWHILPNDTQINEDSIQKILQESKSVLFILDGFDEYADPEKEDCHVIQIIKNDMLQNATVLLTTRSYDLLKSYSPSAHRVKLDGFDENTRRTYLKKAILNISDQKCNEILNTLDQNPVLRDLCQVPLLFVIFVHMTHESEDFGKLKTVSEYLGVTISCFHNHMKKKMKNKTKFESFEKDHYQLSKKALKSLTGNRKTITWEKESLCNDIGKEFYDYYKKVGLLLENENLSVKYQEGIPQLTSQIMVRFYHKIFCEWYASHYLRARNKKCSTKRFRQILEDLNPHDLQYLYRFTCGIGDIRLCTNIIEYLQNFRGVDHFAILCIYEKQDKLEQLTNALQRLFCTGFIISGHDSLILQRSTMHLLQYAKLKEIPVDYVQLHNCLKLVEPATGSITLSSGLTLKAEVPIKELLINLQNRRIGKEEVLKMLQYSLTCNGLKYLGFFRCIPPQSFQGTDFLDKLKSRNVTVLWRWKDGAPLYVLSLLTGRWENAKDGSTPDESYIEEITLEEESFKSSWSVEAYENWVKKGREIARKWASEFENCIQGKGN